MSRVPTAVRQKAQSVDDMIRANAAAAKGEPADGEASVADSALGHTNDPAPAEVVPIAREDSGAEDESDTLTDSMRDVALQQLDATAAEVEEYKQRWKSLDGQLRQRDSQLAQQAEQIARLTELVSNMAEGQAHRTEEPQAPAGVLASDAEDFGDDMVAFVSRIAQAIVQQALSGVQTKVESLEHSVGDVTRSTATIVKKTFQEQLRDLAPRYEEFDTDQAFHDWLAASEFRHNAFYTAVSNRDATSVADYFNMFASLQAPPKESQAATRQQQLEQQIAPKKSSRAPTAEANQADPKIWTRSEIAAAYKKRSRGELAEDAWASLEKEMTQAQQDGRVDYTR